MRRRVRLCVSFSTSLGARALERVGELRAHSQLAVGERERRRALADRLFGAVDTAAAATATAAAAAATGSAAGDDVDDDAAAAERAFGDAMTPFRVYAIDDAVLRDEAPTASTSYRPPRPLRRRRRRRRFSRCTIIASPSPPTAARCASRGRSVGRRVSRCRRRSARRIRCDESRAVRACQ